MAMFTTTQDLVADALWRANEPTDGTSEYSARCLEYLNAIQHGLVLGGGLGVRDLASAAGLYAYIHEVGINDWWWARRRGALVTPRAYTAKGTVQADDTTVSVQEFEGVGADFEAEDFEESDFITLATPGDLSGYELSIDGYPTIYRVTASGTDTLTLDQPWIHTSVVDATIRLYCLELGLPSDFIRFASPPRIRQRGVYQPIGLAALEDLFTEPLGLDSGAPDRCALLSPLTLRLNRYDQTQRHIIEVEYVALPPDLLLAADEPLLPRPHRRVLSTGAASCIMFDKNDAKSKTLASEFKEFVAVMSAEHRSQLVRGSKLFGQFRFRPY